MAIKRYLYLWHRWLGIMLCLFMAVWLVSGVVMLFVGYPKLTPAEHLSRLPTLPDQGCCVEPATVLAQREKALETLRLSTVGGEPFYIVMFSDRSIEAIRARDGARLEVVDKTLAISSARQFGNGAAATYEGLVQSDRWSRSRALDSDRPLHRVRIDDDQQRLLYISSRSGEVVRDATLNERCWNWIGAWLHWLYPLRDSRWWTDIVIYLSLAATVLTLLGQVIGLLRWRFGRPYRSGSRSPYRDFNARWHHIGGLLFGIVLFAWIFSGLMSMRPWHLFENRSTLSIDAFRGGQFHPEQISLPVADTLQKLHRAGLDAVELEWRRINGATYVTGIDASGRSLILSADGDATPQAQLPIDVLIAAARAMYPQREIDVQYLDNYDSYYYAHAEQSLYGGYVRNLPVVRVIFDDPEQSWIYIDPRTGAIALTTDRNSRLWRWAFNLLHSWDWQPLLNAPAARKLLIITFSAGGLIISVSGIVLAWRRLRGRQRNARTVHASAARSTTQG
jgi:uncharacterized iron-regulated membrane protein